MMGEVQAKYWPLSPVIHFLVLLSLSATFSNAIRNCLAKVGRHSEQVILRDWQVLQPECEEVQVRKDEDRQGSFIMSKETMG